MSFFTRNLASRFISRCPSIHQIASNKGQPVKFLLSNYNTQFVMSKFEFSDVCQLKVEQDKNKQEFFIKLGKGDDHYLIVK